MGFTVVMKNASSFQEQLPVTQGLVLPLTHITLPDLGTCRALEILALNSPTPVRDEVDCIITPSKTDEESQQTCRDFFC